MPPAPRPRNPQSPAERGPDGNLGTGSVRTWVLVDYSVQFSPATLAGDMEEGPGEAPSCPQSLYRDRRQTLPRLPVRSLGLRGVGSDRGGLSEGGRCCEVNSASFSKSFSSDLPVQVLLVIELLNPQRLGSPSLPQPGRRAPSCARGGLSTFRVFLLPSPWPRHEWPPRRG